MTDLYRFFDADNQLLYVGISLHAAARASQHRREKSWWGEVTRMEVEHLPVVDVRKLQSAADIGRQTEAFGKRSSFAWTTWLELIERCCDIEGASTAASQVIDNFEIRVWARAAARRAR